MILHLCLITTHIFSIERAQGGIHVLSTIRLLQPFTPLFSLVPCWLLTLCLNTVTLLCFTSFTESNALLTPDVSFHLSFISLLFISLLLLSFQTFSFGFYFQNKGCRTQNSSDIFWQRFGSLRQKEDCLLAVLFCPLYLFLSPGNFQLRTQWNTKSLSTQIHCLTCPLEVRLFIIHIRYSGNLCKDCSGIKWIIKRSDTIILEDLNSVELLSSDVFKSLVWINLSKIEFRQYPVHPFHSLHVQLEYKCSYV